jgi:hypothetical protein
VTTGHRPALPAPPVLARRGLIRTDIEAYGVRDALGQHEAQAVYHWTMAQAVADVALPRHGWRRQPAGDGEFIVLPEGVHEPKVLGRMLPALAARLREYNRSYVRVRLKIAVHQGPIHLNGATGYPGPGAVLVARLVDSDPVRRLLRERPQVNLAAIISPDVYRDVVLNRYEGLRPELFQHVVVDLPSKNLYTEGWLYSPEEDVTRPPSSRSPQ